MSPRRASRRAVATGVLALLVSLLAWAPPATAHDELLFSDPSEAGALTALPSRAILTFTGAIAEVHEVTVTGPDGSVVNGAPTTTGPEVRQNLWSGPEGAYTLTYDVVSSDGHEIAGEIRFRVGDRATAGSPTSAPAASDDESGGVLRGIVVPAGVVLLSGVCALVLWHRRRTTADAA